MAFNIGYDVAGGQFGDMVPGGVLVFLTDVLVYGLLLVDNMAVFYQIVKIVFIILEIF